MIEQLFLEIAKMSLTAGIVILVVVSVRLLLKGMPKRFAYMLWLVVALRLVVPFSVDAHISVFNLFDKTAAVKQTDGHRTHPELTINQMKDKYPADSVGSYAGQVQAKPHMTVLSQKPKTDTKTDTDRLLRVLSLVWIAGILTLMSYTVWMHIMLRRRLRYSVRLHENLYECDMIRSPFVYGLFFPKIYIPFRLSGVQQQCVLAHERYHLQRKDHFIKSFAYGLVIVYWFQPLVWIACRLMCRDMEMSCDEKVTAGFTSEMREEYSRLLLAFASNKRQMPVSPLAFGEENTMARIKNILDYRKPAKWKMIGSTMVFMLTMAACATDAKVEVPATDRAELAADTVTDSMLDSANKVRVKAADGSEAVIAAAVSDKVDRQTQRLLSHQQAQWAENSWCDLELISLDYADTDKIIFHISSGLFEYDLLQQQITHSIDLKALNCQEVQTGGTCKIQIYQNNQKECMAAILPYPYEEADGYIYCFHTDELYAYDTSLLEGYTVYDGLVSRFDLPEEERMTNFRSAENVLPLGNHTYGVLRWHSVELAKMCYEVGEQKWMLFDKEQATLPKLVKQDESFYQSLAQESGKSVAQCSLDYEALYNLHEYDGVCALSTELEYSEELRQAFSERTDKLSYDKEISHSEDEKSYLYRFTCTDENEGREYKVYLRFRYIEGQGWRAEGLPTEESIAEWLP